MARLGLADHLVDLILAEIALLHTNKVTGDVRLLTSQLQGTFYELTLITLRC